MKEMLSVSAEAWVCRKLHSFFKLLFKYAPLDAPIWFKYLLLDEEKLQQFCTLQLIPTEFPDFLWVTCYIFTWYISTLAYLE